MTFIREDAAHPQILNINLCIMLIIILHALQNIPDTQ